MTDNLPLKAVSAVPLSLKDAMTSDTQASIDEMQAGLKVAKGVINVLGAMVKRMEDNPESLVDINPLKLKQIIETNFTALATIRKLRYMDVDDVAMSDASSIDGVLKRIHGKALANTLERMPAPNLSGQIQQETTTTKTRVVLGSSPPINTGLVIDHTTHGKPGKRRA